MDTISDLSDVRIIALGDIRPQIHPAAFVAPGVTLIGDVRLGPGSSIFYGTVLRAEASSITIGADTNVQDNTVMHSDEGMPVTIGARVSVGHRALVHGATVADDCLIGMGSTLLNGSVIGPETLVAAGALVLEGTEIPARSLVAGMPAKVRRELTEANIEHIHTNAQTYLGLASQHATQGRRISPAEAITSTIT